MSNKGDFDPAIIKQELLRQGISPKLLHRLLIKNFSEP